jgi:hypothetical protein
MDVEDIFWAIQFQLREIGLYRRLVSTSWNFFVSLTYNPVGIAHASTARRQRVRLRLKSKGTSEYLPVSGDLKSGIPAEVLTPVHPITRERDIVKKTPVN